MPNRAERSHKIEADADIVRARHTGRSLAVELGFGTPDQALIATAISELARNIVNYASEGWIDIRAVMNGRRQGIEVVARDQGPGIANLEDALTDGFSTGRSLGLGLPGTRRIVDEFQISTQPGKGVTVTVVKWRR